MQDSVLLKHATNHLLYCNLCIGQKSKIWIGPYQFRTSEYQFYTSSGTFYSILLCRRHYVTLASHKTQFYRPIQHVDPVILNQKGLHALSVKISIYNWSGMNNSTCIYLPNTSSVCTKTLQYTNLHRLFDSRRIPRDIYREPLPN